MFNEIVSHTEQFMAGYNAGFNECGRGGGGDFDPPDEAQPYYTPPQRGGINQEDLCNQYGYIVGSVLYALI